MIAELGHFFLVLAFVTATLLAYFPMAGVERNKIKWMKFGRRAAAALFALVTLSFLSLTLCYVFSDFSVLNVVKNSHSMKPFLYKIAGVWGNHEGSMLLWGWVLALWTFCLARFTKKLPIVFTARVLSVQGMLSTGFLAFVLLTSNPFQRIFPTPSEGLGLNPLLQDPALAIHPPFLYAGYVGFSAAFSFAIAALLDKKIDAAWAQALRPWVVAAWGLLTLGIALGSLWAYYELGWGGFWFWDPVENASLMPWLAGTALLHALAVMKKRNALKNWTALLAILTFGFSMLGTFIVRSGVLVSVHAFASDPLRGLFILALLVVTVGGALVLYGLKAPETKFIAFRLLSRETGLMFNNVFLTTFLLTVFMGTLYPVFLSALDLGAVSVGAPYYVAIFSPMLLPFAFLMGASSFAPWRGGRMPQIMQKIKWPLVAATVTSVVLAKNILSGVGFFAGVWIIFAGARDIASKNKMTPGTIAMLLAHAGFALVILGATAATQFGVEKTLVMQTGDHVRVAGRDVSFLGVDETLGENFNAERGIFSLDGKIMTPERRWYPVSATTTSETDLSFDGVSVFYLVLGEDTAEGRVVRIYHHPYIMLIYLGALLMAAGAIVAWREKRG